jgi:hypothetical protein
VSPGPWEQALRDGGRSPHEIASLLRAARGRHVTGTQARISDLHAYLDATEGLG